MGKASHHTAPRPKPPVRPAVLRKGSGRPSGRPGACWLRVVPRPLSTGRPDPSRVTPADRAALTLRTLTGGEAHWRAAFCAVRAGPGCQWRRARAARHPMAQRRSTQPRRTPGSTSCGGLRRTYSPPTGNCQQPFDLRGFTKSAGQCRLAEPHATRRCGPRAHRSAASGAAAGHPFGRSYTVRPPTTVRSAVGSSPPGVRSGRPGVPERGSVDQFATRSSGAWTTRSPTLHTA